MERLEEVVYADPAYKALDPESVAVINTFSGSDFVLEEKDEVTDMCIAIEQMKQRYAEKKLAEEMVRTIENAMKNFHVSLEEACAGLGYSIEGYDSAKRSLLQ